MHGVPFHPLRLVKSENYRKKSYGFYSQGTIEKSQLLLSQYWSMDNWNYIAFLVK